MNSIASRRHVTVTPCWIEEHTNNPKLNLYNRFAADITDVLRVNPNNWVAQTYWYDSNRSHPRPAFTQPAAPAGVPLWAFRQITQLRNLNRFVSWYIDKKADRGRRIRRRSF